MRFWTQTACSVPTANNRLRASRRKSLAAYKKADSSAMLTSYGAVVA
ncbi:hypothetical protein PAP18089_02216 [Pandoraea apista]|uniref:Uncharacterized protein n=1 Tax=Pandoraea apista TaxID=93218 RepID=A0A5E5P408_9BURK|nr:hypothetical protein LMG16407_01288 [Pandoraea apista]VVG71242.1 hypothetical protein PAP18089_02216 [Pandoraea apista]